MITCVQPVEKEEITLFKSGQIIRMDIIKSVYQKTTSDINPNRNNGILNNYYIFHLIEINEQCLRNSINIVKLNLT